MIEPNMMVASWYGAITLFFIGYALFCAVQYCVLRDKGALYASIMFSWLAVGTACVMMQRTLGMPHALNSALFALQRGSYMGVLLGAWWLIDFRLIGLYGEGISLRRLWRFWSICRKGTEDAAS